MVAIPLLVFSILLINLNNDQSTCNILGDWQYKQGNFSATLTFQADGTFIWSAKGDLFYYSYSVSYPVCQYTGTYTFQGDLYHFQLDATQSSCTAYESITEQSPNFAQVFVYYHLCINRLTVDNNNTYVEGLVGGGCFVQYTSDCNSFKFTDYDSQPSGL